MMENIYKEEKVKKKKSYSPINRLKETNIETREKRKMMENIYKEEKVKKKVTRL